MRRWFKADYEEAGIQLWDLPFEMVEHVDPKIQAVIVSECEDQRITFHKGRERFHLVSRCPPECRDQHMYFGQQFGIDRIIRGWFQLTEFETPDGEFMPLNLDDIRAWKAACDAARDPESQSEGIRRLMRTGDEMKADQERVADADLDVRVGRIADRLDTSTRSSRVLPKSAPPERGRILIPRHVAAQIAEERRAKQTAAADE